jgi:hypothetical protein
VRTNVPQKTEAGFLPASFFAFECSPRRLPDTGYKVGPADKQPINSLPHLILFLRIGLTGSPESGLEDSGAHPAQWSCFSPSMERCKAARRTH